MEYIYRPIRYIRSSISKWINKLITNFISWVVDIFVEIYCNKYIEYKHVKVSISNKELININLDEISVKTENFDQTNNPIVIKDLFVDNISLSINHSHLSGIYAEIITTSINKRNIHLLVNSIVKHTVYSMNNIQKYDNRSSNLDNITPPPSPRGVFIDKSNDSWEYPQTNNYNTIDDGKIKGINIFADKLASFIHKIIKQQITLSSITLKIYKGYDEYIIIKIPEVIISGEEDTDIRMPNCIYRTITVSNIHTNICDLYYSDRNSHIIKHSLLYSDSKYKDEIKFNVSITPNKLNIMGNIKPTIYTEIDIDEIEIIKKILCISTDRQQTTSDFDDIDIYVNIFINKVRMLFGKDDTHYIIKILNSQIESDNIIVSPLKLSSTYISVLTHKYKQKSPTLTISNGLSVTYTHGKHGNVNPIINILINNPKLTLDTRKLHTLIDLYTKNTRQARQAEYEQQLNTNKGIWSNNPPRVLIYIVESCISYILRDIYGKHRLNLTNNCVYITYQNKLLHINPIYNKYNRFRLTYDKNVILQHNGIRDAKEHMFSVLINTKSPNRSTTQIDLSDMCVRLDNSTIPIDMIRNLLEEYKHMPILSSKSNKTHNLNLILRNINFLCVDGEFCSTINLSKLTYTEASLSRPNIDRDYSTNSTFVYIYGLQIYTTRLCDINFDIWNKWYNNELKNTTNIWDVLDCSNVMNIDQLYVERNTNTVYPSININNSNIYIDCHIDTISIVVNSINKIIESILNTIPNTKTYNNLLPIEGLSFTKNDVVCGAVDTLNTPHSYQYDNDPLIVNDICVIEDFNPNLTPTSAPTSTYQSVSDSEKSYILRTPNIQINFKSINIIGIINTGHKLDSNIYTNYSSSITLRIINLYGSIKNMGTYKRDVSYLKWNINVSEVEINDVNNTKLLSADTNSKINTVMLKSDGSYYYNGVVAERESKLISIDAILNVSPLRVYINYDTFSSIYWFLNEINIPESEPIKLHIGKLDIKPIHVKYGLTQPTHILLKSIDISDCEHTLAGLSELILNRWRLNDIYMLLRVLLCRLPITHDIMRFFV